MRRLLPIVLISLLLGQGLAVSLPNGADGCTVGGCTPVNCSTDCPTCFCTIDRDRLAPQLISAVPPLEPDMASLHSSSFCAPQPRAREILHVPKASLA